MNVYEGMENKMNNVFGLIIAIIAILMGLTTIMVLGACTFGSEKLCRSVLEEIRK